MIERGPAGAGFAVFLRAANVGGHQVFRPSELARDLSAFGAKSIGAAGTFAFTNAPDRKALEAAVVKALPFIPQVAVVPAAEVHRLLASKPFGVKPPPAGETRYAAALTATPKRLPKFPVDRPEGGTWQLRIVGVQGSFALCARRAKGPGKFYPNDIVEKTLGVPATTRGWNTMEAVGRALNPDSS